LFRQAETSNINIILNQTLLALIYSKMEKQLKQRFLFSARRLRLAEKLS